MSKIYSTLGVNPPTEHAAHENVDTERNATWEAQLSSVIHQATRTDRAVYKSWFPDNAAQRVAAGKELC